MRLCITTAVVVTRRSMRQPKLLSCCLALLLTTPPCCIVLGEEVLLQPSHNRRTPLTAFFRESSSRKRTKVAQRIPTPPSLLLLSSPGVIGIRCGGFGLAESREDSGDGGDVEENTLDELDELSSSLSSQILVDVSSTESEDSLLENHDSEGNVTNLDPSSTSENDDGSKSSGSNEDCGHTESKDEITSSEEDTLSSDEDEASCIAEDSEHSDSDNDISDSTFQQTEVSKLRSSASDRRADGKAFHDEGNLNDAATAFREAASLLDKAIATVSSSDNDSDMVVEKAMCRLHEALCLFKDGRPGDCVKACTDVLEDGVTVVQLEANKDNDGCGTGYRNADLRSSVIKVISAPAAVANKLVIPSQIRARAHHRRAKARLALGDLDGALEDARSAAFMGDRNAVQFYGRLLREGSGAAGGSGNSLLSSNDGLPFGLSEGSGGERGISSNSFLDGILGGLGESSGSNSLVDALMPLLGAGSNHFSSSLLSSLLRSDSGDGEHNSPLGLLGFLSPPPETTKGKARKRGRRKKRGGGMDTFAKSLVTNLVKRMEDVETQELICSYLKSTNTQQIMQISKMAGVPLQLKTAQRLVSLAAAVTPQGISKSVFRVKRGISIIKTVRKVLKVVDEYKTYIVVAVLCCWIRSALMQPYVMSAKQAKKIAQKAAFGLMIAPPGGTRSMGCLCGERLRALSKLFLSGSEDKMRDNGGISKMRIEEKLAQYQNQLSLIVALEKRNKAQLGSFIDEDDQWDSLDEEEQIILRSKDLVIQKMEDLTEQLVMSFMGQKMMDG